MKQFLLISLLFLSVFAKAQNTYLPDEIWYNTGENIYVQFCLPTVSNLDQYTDAPKTFAALYPRNIQERIRESEKTRKISIELDEETKLFSIETADELNTTSLLPAELSEDSLFHFQKLKLVTSEGAKINCYFRNFDELMMYLKNDWNKKTTSLSGKIKEESTAYKRKAVSLLYQEKDGQVQKISKSWNSKVNNLDQLQLTGSVGINAFKSKMLPSLKFHLGFVFSQKGYYRDHYFIDYEIMYDFVSENNKMNAKTGHFIDLGYQRNFSKSPEKADWYGVSAGYLIHNKSNIFDDHTWRISVYRNITKNIQLVPQIYFPENFSKVFPGLNLNINF